MISKLIKCIDCGKEVEVDAWDMKTERCRDCQHERDKENAKIRMRKYRNNSRMLR